jgi:thioredoxin reductase
MIALEDLPVAVIGGGPVGLAAAAHLIARGLPVKLYEAGETVAASLRDWGHVRTFSPWQYNIDSAAEAILRRRGWRPPRSGHMPTGAELYEDYLKPLAVTPEIAGVIETGARVTSITRRGADKVVTMARETKPFLLSVTNADGTTRRDLARVVIDASGTWRHQNPLGAGGVPAEGETEHADRIAHGIPDVLGRDRVIYAGRRTLVIGAGYSAGNVLLDLAQLARSSPHTAILWVVRGNNLIRIYGGGLADQLPARGELGGEIKALVDDGRVELVMGFAATAVRHVDEALILEGETAEGLRQLGPVDRIIVATGQRPDLDLTRELRLELDPSLECPRALASVIDPNVHFCGSVPPHGHRELGHPEPGFYTVGIKSYGRAPTFLLLTGYEQVRSVVAAIAGDIKAADHVQLALPESGVCSTALPTANNGTGGCCGAPALPEDACGMVNASADTGGRTGCDSGVAA